MDRGCSYTSVIVDSSEGSSLGEVRSLMGYPCLFHLQKTREQQIFSGREFHFSRIIHAYGGTPFTLIILYLVSETSQFCEMIRSEKAICFSYKL